MRDECLSSHKGRYQDFNCPGAFIRHWSVNIVMPSTSDHFLFTFRALSALLIDEKVGLVNARRDCDQGGGIVPRQLQRCSPIQMATAGELEGQMTVADVLGEVCHGMEI